MHYKHIKLINWGPHSEFETSFNKSGVNALLGDNDVGKSHIIRALAWIFTTGNTEYGGKEDMRDGSVYTVVDVDVIINGSVVAFKKSMQFVNDKHTTLYEINGEPMTATEYKLEVENYLGNETNSVLSLVMNMQEAIHKDIKDKPTPRNKRMRKMMQMEEPDQWGKELRAIVEEKAKELSHNQGRIFGIEGGLIETKEELTQKLLVANNNIPIINKEASDKNIKEAQEAISIIDVCHLLSTQLTIKEAVLLGKKGDLETKQQENKDNSIKKVDIISLEQKVKENEKSKKALRIKNAKEEVDNTKKLIKSNLSIEKLIEIKDIFTKYENDIINIEDSIKNTEAKIKNITIDDTKKQSATTAIEWWNKQSIISNNANCKQEYARKQIELTQKKDLLTSISNNLPPIQGQEASILLDRIWKHNKTKCPITGANISFLNDALVDFQKSMQEAQSVDVNQFDIETLVKAKQEVETLQDELKSLEKGLELLSYKEANDIIVSEQRLLQYKEQLKTDITKQKDVEKKIKEINAIINKEGLDKSNLSSEISTKQALVFKDKFYKDTTSDIQKVELNELLLISSKPLQSTEIESLEKEIKDYYKNKENIEKNNKELLKLEIEIKTEETSITSMKKDIKTKEKEISRELFDTQNNKHFILSKEEKEKVEKIKKGWENKIAIREEQLKLVKEIKEDLDTNSQKLVKLEIEKKALQKEEVKIESARELYKFLGAKRGPQQLLKIALQEIVDATNKLLPQVGLERQLSLDKHGDFLVEKLRNNKYVKELASRLGVGLSTLIGMCLKIAMIKVITPNIKTIIFDEPSAALHESRSKELGEFFRKVQKYEPELQIIIVEHDTNVAEACHNTIYVKAS